MRTCGMIGRMRIIDSKFPKSSGHNIYPWAEWTDGKHREAERGTDYNCSDLNFASICRMYAKRHGHTVICRMTADGVAFQFNPPA